MKSRKVPQKQLKLRSLVLLEACEGIISIISSQSKPKQADEEVHRRLGEARRPCSPTVTTAILQSDKRVPVKDLSLLRHLLVRLDPVHPDQPNCRSRRA